MDLSAAQQQFQLTAARRRLEVSKMRDDVRNEFQLTAARRRLGATEYSTYSISTFQLTAARRRLGVNVLSHCSFNSFNSQPPEGGWTPDGLDPKDLKPFQLTAARRRLGIFPAESGWWSRVSTHSRPKAAGKTYCPLICICVFQLTAARRRLEWI